MQAVCFPALLCVHYAVQPEVRHRPSGVWL